MILWVIFFHFVSHNPASSRLTSWREWASTPSCWQRRRGKSQTDWRPTNDAHNETKKKQAQHNDGTTRSVVHAFSWSVHPIPNQTPPRFHLPATDDQTLQIHRYPWIEVKRVPFRDLGIKGSFYIYKEKWETEDPKQYWLCIWLFRENLGKGSSS